jgi:glycosyltransferase involved in cell wall biosynthesis
MKIPKVCIAIPVYNEEKDLENSINKLIHFLANNFHYPYFIVIADNASIDNTGKIGKELSKKHKQVKYNHIPKKGRGLALRDTWTRYNADIYSYMDVDLSINIESFPELIDLIAKQNFDIAIGSRHLKHSKVKRSLKRAILSRGYNLILKLAFNQKFKDSQCGFKAVSKKVVKEVIPKIKNNKWFFDTELLIKSEKLNYNIREIPITLIDDPNSKVNILDTIAQYLENIVRLRKELKNEVH